MYGMHPNAGVLLSTSMGENLFKTITEVSGGSAGRVYRRSAPAAATCSKTTCGVHSFHLGTRMPATCCHELLLLCIL
jgi:hypothetical protein